MRNQVRRVGAWYSFHNMSQRERVVFPHRASLRALQAYGSITESHLSRLVGQPEGTVATIVNNLENSGVLVRNQGQIDLT